MKRILLWSAFAAALVTSLGCDSSNSVTGASPNVNGSWAATMTVTGGTQAAPGTQFTVSFSLVQSGTDVFGTYSAQGGADGLITGTISGQTVTMTADQSPPCDGSYTGVGTVDPASTSISGTYDGSDCFGTLQATFTAVRE